LGLKSLVNYITVIHHAPAAWHLSYLCLCSKSSTTLPACPQTG